MPWLRETVRAERDRERGGSETSRLDFVINAWDHATRPRETHVRACGTDEKLPVLLLREWMDKEGWAEFNTATMYEGFGAAIRV